MLGVRMTLRLRLDISFRTLHDLIEYKAANKLVCCSSRHRCQASLARA